MSTPEDQNPTPPEEEAEGTTAAADAEASAAAQAPAEAAETPAEETPAEAEEAPAAVAESSAPEEAPAVPAEEAPVVPAEEAPVVPAEEAPAVPAEEAPVVPAEETPAVPAEETPAVATTPASPAAVPARKRDQRRAPGEPVVVRAQAKYVRTSARKARLVCDNIRGKDVTEARAILAFTPRAVAEAWSKLLESAVANAENNHDLVGDELKILQVFADEGPTLKRFRPRAMGRASRIRKRTSHLTITLTPKES